MGKRFELLADMQANGTYHVFNRTNNKEILFRDEEDHLQFLHSYNRFLNGYLTTYAWALLPNHFHFVISVADELAIRQLLRKLPTDTLTHMEKHFLLRKIEITDLIRMQWARLFISYSRYFNQKYGRQGNLFFRSFKRKTIADYQQLRNTIVYVHLNPLKHAITPKWQTYKWSSWRTITARKHTPVPLDLGAVLKLFDEPNAWIEEHTQQALVWQNQPHALPPATNTPSLPDAELIASDVMQRRRAMLFVPSIITTPTPSPIPSR